ncbi:Repeat domain-containing protein [Nannocystis exedens]|uniref:Repeat domain-containing protein n=2 Tax=Nannocystis exedens TaxID=54 RepID=A0A1I2FHW7_9BACT|nr:FG-GAP repeat protein [Nannocystis exedens]SFF04106.1 Repeat domain-containing protein [Nannocystis exedens]
MGEMPTSEAPTSETPTSEATIASTTEPGTSTTGGSACEGPLDCGECELCIFGRCLEDDACCERESRGERCRPPEFECSDDGDCPAGQVCEPAEQACVPGGPAKVPACPAPAREVSQSGLSHAPSAFVLADLDGDGDLDLLAAQPSAGQIELAWNDGTGTFVADGEIDLGSPGTDVRIAAADLDGDGSPDLAVLRDEVLGVWFGQGGVFTPGPVFMPNSKPRLVHVVDGDGDGANDLLTINEYWPGMWLWRGDGLGGFTLVEEANYDEIGLGTGLADLDGDGRPDVMSPPGSNSHQIKILLGQASGVWDLHELIQVAPTTWTRLLGGDLDGQGAPALVGTRQQRGEGLARVWPATAPAEWSAEVVDFHVGQPLFGAEVIDVTGDGLLDLVSATQAPVISVLVGDGAGGFVCEQLYTAPAATAPEVLRIADVDGDGNVDLIAGSRAATTVLTIRAL